jgi:hypothetical protein
MWEALKRFGLTEGPLATTVRRSLTPDQLNEKRYRDLYLPICLYIAHFLDKSRPFTHPLIVGISAPQAIPTECGATKR